MINSAARSTRAALWPDYIIFACRSHNPVPGRRKMRTAVSGAERSPQGTRARALSDTAR